MEEGVSQVVKIAIAVVVGVALIAIAVKLFASDGFFEKKITDELNKIDGSEDDDEEQTGIIMDYENYTVTLC